MAVKGIWDSRGARAIAGTSGGFWIYLKELTEFIDWWDREESRDY